MGAWRRRLATALGMSGLVLAGAEAAAQQARFADRTEWAGLDVVHTPVPFDSVGDVKLGGGAVGDFDRDGWLDVFLLLGGGVPDALYMNRGGGTSHGRVPGLGGAAVVEGQPGTGPGGTFVDRAAAWGVDHSHAGAGATVGDYDNDGRLDLFVTSHGPTGTTPGQHRLYHNEGDHFTDQAAAAGVAFTSPEFVDGYGSAFGDIDGDGDLDLFVAGWNASQVNPSFGNILFRNEGDGTFTDVTTESGLFLALIHSFTPLFVDMDRDRDQDLLIAADFSTSKYLVNDGSGNFTDLTFTNGTGLDTNGMGQCVADLDRDGRLDWYVTSIQAPTGTGNKLYRNLGGNQFTETSDAAGVNLGEWGWGVVAVDVDHDGWEDLVETNGWPTPPWNDLPSLLFMNQGGRGAVGSFVESGAAAGLDHALDGKAVMRFDADNDGDQDLLFVANNQPVRYYRNELSGPDTHWLHVTLDSRGAPGVAPDGYGALVIVQTPDGGQQRALNGGGTYLGCSELSAHFGLGPHTNATVRVEWPDGTVDVAAGVAADQRLVISY